MNNTSYIYSAGEQAAISLAGLLVCPSVCAVIYYIARTRLRVKETENSKSKAYLFYRLISGLLFGHFLSHTDWGTLYTLVYVGIGFFALDAAEGVARIWNTNPNIIGPADYNHMHDDFNLNKQTMEVETVIVSRDVKSPEFAEDIFIAQDYQKDNTKRQWMLGCLIALLCVLSINDGIYMVYRFPQTPLAIAEIIICYYVNALTMSVAVCGAMIHARFHTTEEDRPRIIWWASISGVWSIVFFSGGCVVLSGIQWQTTNDIMHSGIFLGFYSTAAGVLLKMQFYFHNMKLEKTDKPEVIGGIVVFGLAMGQAIATSFYL